jgi:cytochrome c oxidase subunit 3
MEGHFVSTNTYFSSYYFFTALHGLHLLGGLFFWGKISSRIFKLKEEEYVKESNNLQALSIYWLFLFIVWLVFFAIMFIYNDSVIAWCIGLVS